MSSFLDKLAETNSHLIANDKIANDNVLLCRTFEPSELTTAHNKKAHFFDRVEQAAEDMHKSSESPNLWTIKGSKIVRLDNEEIT